MSNSSFQPREETFEDVTGHGDNAPISDDSAVEADVEGHGRNTPVAEGDDVEGHRRLTSDEDDVEGHRRLTSGDGTV